MENIVEVRDIVELILQTVEIERDAAFGSNIIIPVYEISPEDFLNFAEKEIADETKEGIINAVSNLKRALDCEMDIFFESINIKRVFDNKNLKFEKKTQFLANIGLFPIQTINKLNLVRNKLEHDYKIPAISDLRSYYELVLSVVKIINLYLELFFLHGEIALVFNIQKNKYYFTIGYDVKQRAFAFEITDWTDGKAGKKKRLKVSLKDKRGADDFIKAFNIFLLSIQYFNYGNLNLYKNRVKKLTEV